MATNELQLVGGRNYKAISCALQLLITKDYQVNKIAPNPPHTLSKEQWLWKLNCSLLENSDFSFTETNTAPYWSLPFKVFPSQKFPIAEYNILNGFVIDTAELFFCRCWENEAWEHGSFKVHLCKEQTLPPPLDLRLISPLLLQIPCSMSALILSYSYIKQSLVVHQQHMAALCILEYGSK